MNQKMKSIAWLIFGLLLIAGLLYLAINATHELNSEDYNPDAIVRAWRVIGACFGYIGAFVTLLYVVFRPLNSLLHGHPTKASEND